MDGALMADETMQQHEDDTLYPNRTVYGQFKDRLNFGAKALADFKRTASMCFDYYQGDQIPNDIKQQMIDQQRPPLVINQILSIVNSVTGTEMTNKYEPHYKARTIDDYQFNEILSDTVKWVRQQSDIVDEESTSFMDTAICGVGCVNYYQDYSERLEGKTRADSVPIFELTWDPTAKKRNMRDRRWVIRHKWFARQEATSRWPDKKELIDSKVTDDQTGITSNEYEAYVDGEGAPGVYNKERDELLIYEYQYYVMEERIFFEDPVTGEERKVTRSEWEELQATYREENEAEPEYVELPQKVYYRAFFAGDTVLEHELLPTQKSGFSYKFITAFRKRVENRVEWFGVVAPAIDPQKYANSMLSNLMHTVSTNPKGAVLAEEGVVKDPAKARQDWGKPNPWITVADGALAGGELQIIKGQYPDELERLYQLSLEAVPRIIGFSPIQLGAQADLRRTSSQTVRLVQQSSDVMLSQLFSSLKAYRQESGYTHLEYIELFMPEGTIVRVTQPDGVQAPVEFKRDWVDKVQYDVIVDEQAATPSNLEALWESLQQTQSLELLIQSGAMPLDVVVDIMPFLTDPLRQRMKQNIQQQDQVGQLMQMVQGGDVQGAMQMLQQLAAPQGAPGQQQPSEEEAVQ